MRIVVVGGGVGGLTAARSLLRAGFDVLVLEQAPSFGAVGAGLQLGPNATRILTRLGLADELAEVGISPAAVRMLRWHDDAVLSNMRLAQDARARFGAPYYVVYRADLIELLSRGLPEGTVRFGAEVVDVTTGDKPEVRLADGTVESADVVVGADGTHSKVRAATIGDVPARFARMIAYRSLIPWAEVPGDPEQVVRTWLGPGRHVTTYPVGRGCRYLSVSAVLPEPVRSAESWTASGGIGELRAQLAGWNSTVRELTEAITGTVYRWALYEREPLLHWSTSCTTLVGDACHPMLPFMAQGAAQAVEDAAALAACLRRTPGEVGAALARYEVARQPHTTRIQQLSWSNNTAYHLQDGPEQKLRDEGLRASRTTTEALHWLYGNDPERLPD
ncbi:MAG TPA: FAD-dependent monooxygenase [Pseudonocardia sp.]|jgi:salicylate hydroxylase|nr:FAD-dependent monooxygenase [Pseudonocardia sp.]